MRKCVSLFLVVLMLVSCIPAAFFSVSAAEPASETPAVSYKDPREDATKIYYALGGSLTATDALVTADEDFDAANVINSGYNVWGVLCNAKVMSKTFEPGSVLVVKFKGSLSAFADATNASLRKSYNNFLGAATIFRSDNTKLPIVIEGVQENRASVLTISPSSASILAFANDYYFTNLTLKKAASTGDMTLYGGSGRVVFDNVSFDLSGNVTIGADNYNADCFYEWNQERINANKGKDGLIESSITFGKDAALPTSSSGGIIISAVACNAHNGSTNFKNTYLASGVAFDETVAETVKTYASAQRFVPGSKNLVTSESKCIVYPTMTKASVIIDNGKANSDTADFGNIYVRRGCNAVGASEIKILSGNVNTIYLDTYTAADSSNKKEIYYGDIKLTVDGGKILNRVYGLKYAYLVGDYTAELKSGYIKRFDGTDSTAENAALNGNYLFHVTGGTMNEYYGACEVIGEGNTVETRVEGGTFTSVFSCVRFGVSEITNNISGGDFQNAFFGATRNNYAGGNVTNNISGTHNTTKFATAYTFCAGGENASATLGTVVTNISGGAFGLISKGAAKATSNTLNIVSKEEADSIRFNNSSSTVVRSHTFDNFEMNGGTIHFYNCTVTANNAKGNVTVRSLGSLNEGVDYFTFTPVSKGALNVTATSISTKARVVYEGEKIYVRADFGDVSPTGASLILTERIAVKFVFDKAAVDAIGKDNFDCAVILNGIDLTANAKLVENGNTYTLTTMGIGLPDSKTPFAISGDSVRDANFTIASLADTAIAAWETTEPEWSSWAKALKNLIGVVVDQAASTVAPTDKNYEKFVADKNDNVVTDASATLVMNSAVGVKLGLTYTNALSNPVVKVNGKAVDGAYTADVNKANVTLYFAPQSMEKVFTVSVLDGENQVFTLDATVAGFAKALNTDAGNALLAYIQATTVVAE